MQGIGMHLSHLGTRNAQTSGVDELLAEYPEPERAHRTKVTLREHQKASLLEVAAAHTKAGARHAGTDAHKTNPAVWFDAFDQGESTYTYDGTLADPEVNSFTPVRDGWNPHEINPFTMGKVKENFFQETDDGGPANIWQTFYPAAPGAKATGKWFRGTGGTWQQEYMSQNDLKGLRLDPAWFDSSVAQNDEYSRMNYPDSKSPRWNYAYVEKSVNTSLTCDAPGCIANSSLQAPFDPATEMAKDCKISIYFHPTDFENEFLGERVEYITVNGANFATACHPYADGCNQSASRPLIPCVLDVPLDMVLNQSAPTLVISSKVTNVVDECPYNGNYLSAVPMVTCMVAPQEAPPAMQQLADEATVKNGKCTLQAPIQCDAKGCLATAEIPVSTDCASKGSCKLSINVTQTDFDNDDGTSELIEYIQVDGINASTSLNPGQNPCKSRWQGNNVTQDQLVYSALSNYALVNVTNTSSVTQRSVLVKAKISHWVDECASNGYLLDGMATIVCG
jgi:hypothetical protein